jgi:hypothetical protein
MFCSKCGSEASPNQKFCRSCGNKLFAVSSDDPDSANIANEGNERKNPITQAANYVGITGTILLAAMLAGLLIIGLIYNLVHEEMPELVGHMFHIGISIALITATVGVFLKILGWLIGPKLSVHQNTRKALAQNPRTNRLEVEHSITDRTTDLLDEKVAKAKDVESEDREEWREGEGGKIERKEPVNLKRG